MLRGSDGTSGTAIRGGSAAPILDSRPSVSDNVDNFNTRSSRGELGLATMNFSVPDDVRAAFNKTFAGTNRSALLTGLMRQAVEERRRQKRRARAISRLLELRGRLGSVSRSQVARARRSQRP
jgi:hypothetical protein